MIVTLPLKKELHRNFLGYLFPYVNGCYQISRKQDFGKLICSRVRHSELPVKNIAGVQLFLPLTRATDNAKNHFLYFSKEDQHKLEDELEVMFNIDFDRYYLNGRKLGYMQKDIIHAYIISRKLITITGDVEMLRKREYRDAVKMIEIRTKSLLKRAQYRNERIEEAMLSLNRLNVS